MFLTPENLPKDIKKFFNKELQDLPSCSNILSHSSRMKCLICLRLSDFSRASAKILPGVPTTMCGQLVFRVCWSFLMLMPPKNTETLMLFMYLENLSYSLEIWKANSRVWHITSTLTWPSICSSCWRVAKTNTAVLPMPLLAWQMISMPKIAWGMHSCWTEMKRKQLMKIWQTIHHMATVCLLFSTDFILYHTEMTVYDYKLSTYISLDFSHEWEIRLFANKRFLRNLNSIILLNNVWCNLSGMTEFFPF